jgi:hypothetical protein
VVERSETTGKPAPEGDTIPEGSQKSSRYAVATFSVREGFCDPSGIVSPSGDGIPVVSLRSTTGYPL